MPDRPGKNESLTVWSLLHLTYENSVSLLGFLELVDRFSKMQSNFRVEVVQGELLALWVTGRRGGPP